MLFDFLKKRKRPEIDLVSRKMAQHWRSQGLHGGSIPNIEIRILEKEFGRLPPAYKRFLKVAGSQIDGDENGYWLWPPADILHNSRRFLDDMGSSNLAEDCIIIGDYLQYCWFYALWITGPESGQVFCVDGVNTIGPFTALKSDTLLDGILNDASVLHEMR